MREKIKWSPEADDMLLFLWTQPGQKQASGTHIAKLINAAELCHPPASRDAVLARLRRLRLKLGEQAVPARPEAYPVSIRAAQRRRQS